MSGYIGTQPVPQATQTRDAFTATAGQTSFATSGYTPNFLDVFLNGVKLAAADYTATNGSDVVLASGAVVNDILEVVAYTTFESDSGTFTGVVTANAGVKVDNITIDGTTIALSSGDLTLDAAGNIILNADGGGVYFKDGSALIGSLQNSSSDLVITSEVQDKDIIFKGIDGGSSITALTLDMSDGGTATFNHDIKLPDSGAAIFGNDGDLSISNSGTGGLISASNGDLEIRGAGASVGNVLLRPKSGENGIIVKPDDAVLLYHNNSKKFETTSVGVTVTGSIGTVGDLNIGNNDSSNPLSKLRFGATQHGAADIRPSDEGGHKVGLDFYTDGTGDVTINPTFAMRINKDGHLLVGKTSTSSSVRGVRFAGDTPGYSEHTNSGGSCFYLNRLTNVGTIIQFAQANSNVGSISVSGSATAYNTSSDYRLKENVVDLTGASARVNQLDVKRFNFIADDTNTLVDGFLAHEVATVVPEAITGTKDAMKDEEYEVTAAIEEVRDADGNVTTEAADAVMGTRSVPDMQGIDQSKIVPLLTAALQEALTEIASLKTGVEALTARITTLEGE